MQRVTWRNVIRLTSLCILLFTGAIPSMASAMGSAPSAASGTITAAPSTCGADDLYNTNKDTTLSIAAPGILANDSRGAGTPRLPAIYDTTAHGILSVAPTGAFTYTPNSGYVGNDTFTYTLKCYTIEGDVTEGYAKVTITVGLGTVINPCGFDDSYGLLRDTTLTIPAPGFLANDGAGRHRLVSVTSTTTHGTLTTDLLGGFTYTPNSGYVGSDSFTYSLSCNYGDGSSTGYATVNLVVRPPSPPCVLSDDSYTTPVNTTLVDNSPGVLRNDNLLCDSEWGIWDVSAATHGKAQVWSNGTMSYEPDPGFSGTDSFTYMVKVTVDGIDAHLTATVTVTIGAVPTATPTMEPTVTPTAVPVACAAADDSYTTAQNTALDVVAPGVLGNDVGPGASVSFVGTGPSHGTINQAPDGSLTYIPDAGFVGTDTYTYVIGCTGGSDSVGTVTITVTSPSVPNATPVVGN